MIATLAGSISFIFMLEADWADSRELSVLSVTGKFLAFVSFSTAFIFLLCTPPTFELSVGFHILGYLLSCLWAFLLLSSLYLELHRSRHHKMERHLVTSGTYSLVRHPGVLWLFGLQSSLVLASGSWGLLKALPIWTLMNLILVYAQDRYILPRIFGTAYRVYQQEVPFLLPHGSSIKRLLSAKPDNYQAPSRTDMSDGIKLRSICKKEASMASTVDLLRQGRKAEIWQQYCGYLDLDAKGFMSVQHRLLEEQLGKYCQCELWTTIMKGRKPRNAEELRKWVPLTTYKDYAPFLVPKREESLPEKADSWVHTSGRSGEYETKWIPYPRKLYEQVGEAFLAAFLVAASNERGEVRLREGMTFPFLLAPPPYISGIIAKSMLERFPFRVLPDLERGMAMGFQERIMTAFEEAMSEGLDFFWGMTSILMKLGESFGKPSTPGTSMARLLKLARRPKALARIMGATIKASMQGRPLMPKDIWKISGAICGGMDTTILKDKVAELWGIEPMEGYGCTEFGAIAFQSWSHKHMTFYPYMDFWEFVSEKDYKTCLTDHDFIPDALFMDEVKAGTEYVLVGTNFHGGSLVRYILGDLVKITALEDTKDGIKLPQMSFVSRIDGLIDIGGFTRLTEKTIWQAIENTGVGYEDWTIRKENIGGSPILKLYIELKHNDHPAETIADLVHNNLREIDAPYRDMEEIASLRPLSVTLLSKGTFKRYMEERQAAGADLAHTKPAHVNVSDKVIESLIRMSNWKL